MNFPPNHSPAVALAQRLAVPHQLDVPLGPLTWYGVGGPAQVLAKPTDREQLAMLVKGCHKQNIPLYVLGSGANLLVRDQGVEGIVVRLDAPAFKQVTISDNAPVIAGAGYDLAKLVLQTAKAGRTGLQCMAGIPASVGGAIRMNAGGAFGDIGSSILSLTVMDRTGEVYQRHRDDLVFSYRKTNITARFILEATFDLSPDDPEELMRRVKEIFAYKSASQPLRAYSAGCAFKNPPAEVGATAGQLLDRAGLKGYARGGAAVSDIHANFVIAHKHAAADDIFTVIEHMQAAVFDASGVMLEREVAVWP